MKRLLQLSLLLNVLLLIAAGWRSAHRPPMNRMPRSEVGQPAGKSPRHSIFSRASSSRPARPWDAVETSDPQCFIANLRAIGCPEQTIRDIITMRVCRTHRGEWVEAEAEAARVWDFTRNRNPREWRERNRRQTALRNEVAYTLESLFGGNWRALTASLLGWPWRGNDPMQFLNVEKRRQLRELDMRYGELKNELEHKGFTGRLDAEDAARLRDLDRQKQTELATILSPQELADYLYRQSPAADYVRQRMPEARSESEFRAMVKVALEFQMAESPAVAALRSGLEPGDPAVIKADAERRKAFDQRLKEVLGEQRIAEQQAEEQVRVAEERRQHEEQDKQRFRTELAEMAGSVGIAEADAQRFFDRLMELKPTLEPKLEEMQKNLTGTPEEKQKRMEAEIKAELEKIALEIMGEKGRALAEKMAKSGR